MINRPDASATSQGIARFLLEELRPVLTDKVLSYKVLIAAHLASGLSREVALDAAFRQNESLRMRGLLPSASRASATSELQEQLLVEIRDGRTEAARLDLIRAVLLDSLREELVAVNPFFDTGPGKP